MPSVNFNIKWPDGENISYYSPSTIIREFIKKNESYTQTDFSEIIFKALDSASERVYQKFGYHCSAATDEKLKIEEKLSELKQNNYSGKVVITEVG